MAWPKIEVHFSTMDHRQDKTVATVRVYTCADGGLDSQGNQILVRTLRKNITAVLDAGTDPPRLVQNFLARRVALNAEFGTNIALADFICNL